MTTPDSGPKQDSDLERELSELIVLANAELDLIPKPFPAFQDMTLEEMMLAHPIYFSDIDPSNHQALLGRFLQRQNDYMRGVLQNTLPANHGEEESPPISPENKPKTIGKKEIAIGAMLALVAALGINYIFGNHAHGLQSIKRALDLLIDQQRHPQTVQPTQVASELSTFTPTPEATPTMMSSPTASKTKVATTPTEGVGDEPPQDHNEFVNYIDATQFDNDSQNTMHTDLYILGGEDGKQTAVVGMPYENSSNTLENFEKPKYLLRFNPARNRWERLTLATNKIIIKISYRNNPGKIADGFSIVYAEGGNDPLSSSDWEYFDPNDSTNQSELGKWSSAIVAEIKAHNIFYPQDPKRHIPIKSGLAVFFKK